MSGKMKTHKDLDVWKKSVDFVVNIYRITSKFPKEEIYGITSQIRRASVSIPSNIAEGAGRNSDKEFLYFLSIALGSIAETDTQLLISKELNFMAELEYENLLNDLIEVRKMILGLRKYINGK